MSGEKEKQKADLEKTQQLDQACKQVAVFLKFHGEGSKHDAFTASTILAVAFAADKQLILDRIMHWRGKTDRKES